MRRRHPAAITRWRASRLGGRACWFASSARPFRCCALPRSLAVTRVCGRGEDTGRGIGAGWQPQDRRWSSATRGGKNTSVVYDSGGGAQQIFQAADALRFHGAVVVVRNAQGWREGGGRRRDAAADAAPVGRRALQEPTGPRGTPVEALATRSTTRVRRFI